MAADATPQSSELRNRILEFTAIRSYPGEERAMAIHLAAALSTAGVDVVIDEQFPGSPSVIGRLRLGKGRTLQFAGHLDTIPVPHDPPHYRDGRIYGRGACDMKAGLAAIVEAVRLLAASPGAKHGELLVTAYGLHEGPGNYDMHAPLRGLLSRGIRGDAVIVCEGPEGIIPVAGKGSLTFRATFERNAGGPLHELMREGDQHPILAAHRFITMLLERSATWTLTHDMVGGESVFFGSIHGGEIYNTVPTSVEIHGTRRYPPGRMFEEARAELGDVAHVVERESGVSVTLSVQRSGQPWDQGPDAAIIRAVTKAHMDETGSRLPLGGQLFSSDINHFVADFGVPGAAYGVSPTAAHSTPEYVELSDAERLVRVLVRSGTEFLAGQPEAEPSGAASRSENLQ